MTDELDVALAVAGALERVGSAYFVGGSVASSLHGEPRSTNDVDFIVDLPLAQVDAFIAGLGSDFEADADALKDAARRRSSWNIFHLPLVVKIDIFIVGDSEFDRVEMNRRRRTVVRDDGAALWLKSPEDTILRKLLWYQDGGCVSDRQWRDVLGVLRVSAATLDTAHLDTWAAKLGIMDLLARARDALRDGGS